MSTNLVAAGPLSDGVRIGLHVPVILLGLAGVVLAFVLMRRLGVLAVILAAIGSLLVVIDQVVNILWIQAISAFIRNGTASVEDFNTTDNAFTIADAVLVTLAAGFLIFAFVVRRPANRATQAPTGLPVIPPAYPSPDYAQSAYGQPPGSAPPAYGQPGGAWSPPAYGQSGDAGSPPTYGQPAGAGSPPAHGQPGDAGSPPAYGQPAGPGSPPPQYQAPNYGQPGSAGSPPEYPPPGYGRPAGSGPPPGSPPQ